MAVTTIATYNLDGTTVDFTVPFEYLSRSFVVITVRSQLTGTNQVLVQDTDYKWTSNTNIQLTSQPDAQFDEIEIKRVTSSIERIVTFQDGSIIRAADLNKAELQTMHIAEEARDAAQSSVQLDNNNNYDVLNRRLVHVADGQDPNDAVNMKQFAETITSATGILTQTQGVKDATDVIRGQAENARDIAIAQATKSTNQATASQGSANAAKISETNAHNSEIAAKASEDAAHTSEVNASGYAGNAAASAAAAKLSEQHAKTSETNAATSQADSLTEANRAKVEADRAKAEADRAATGNAIVGALNSIDATTHVVDFKAMPKVNGVDVTAALTSGGFQVNSNVVCGDGETNNTDKLQDNKYSGKSFMVAKPKTVNSTTGVTSNGAPAAMEYDWAVCNDFYGTWTPTGGIEGKTRVQTIYDKNAIWVRGYHHQDATWTPWKRVNSQFYNNVSGIDANTITTDGSYFYFKDTAQVTTPNTPHIDSPEDSDVYFLTVNADDSGKEIVQTVLSPKTNSRFDRYCVNGSWSRWWNSTATIDFDTAPAGFNLDNETNPGFWNCELSTTTGTPASLRSGKALVSIYADAFGNVKQELVYASLQATWVRYKSPVFTWSQWVRLATANDQGVVDFAHGGTGGNSKAAAQTSLGIEMPSNGSIAPGINLDQFKGDGYKGYWRQPLTTAASNAGANYPVPEAGLLTVEVSGANGNGTTQTYRTWETNQEFTRTWQAVQGNVNMGKWSPWHTKLNAFVIDNFFLKPDGSQDPDAAKNGWDKAHPPTRGVMTNIYFHPQPSKLKNTVSTPQYLDPPTNKVPNPDYPGYQDANAPWGFGINDKDRSLQIWGGPTESATPDYTSGLEGITGSRRFQIGAMTQVVTSNPVGAVQIKNPGGYQYFTVTLPNGFLTTRNPDGSGGTGLASDSIGAIRMGGNASTGAVQIDACYQGALKWNGNKAKTGGDISSEWNTALEPSLAQNGSSSSIQMNRNGQMKYNCGADGHYFNRTVVSNGAFISTNGAFYARDGNHPAGKEGILQTDGNVKGLSWATSAGVAQYATTWCTTKFAPKTSDIRLKEGVEAISGEDALAMVNKMKPVSYKYKTKDNSSWNTGIIAQDIEKLEPRLITTALETLADGTEIEDAKHVGKMDGIYIAAIQQLTKRIEELEAKLAQK